MSRLIDLDDPSDLPRLRLRRLENSTCVPKSNSKIPSDRVLASALKRNPASLYQRSNPKEKGHVSIKVSKIPSDRVLACALKRNPALTQRSSPNEVECASIKVSKMTKKMKQVFNRMLQNQIHFEKRKIQYHDLYGSVSEKIHSGPGYNRRKCVEMKKIYDPRLYFNYKKIL